MAINKIPKSKAKTAYSLLSEVRKLILDEPRRYNQSAWLERGLEAASDVPACGTVGCVAGWIAVLKGGKRLDSGEHSCDVAIDILGIRSEQKWRLFDGGVISPVLRPGTKAYAEAGAKHIAKFQKANRAQLLAKKV